MKSANVLWSYLPNHVILTLFLAMSQEPLWVHCYHLCPRLLILRCNLAKCPLKWKLLSYALSIIKKPSLDHTRFSNYRPVSNLTFISKEIEKSVANQLIFYFNKNIWTRHFSQPTNGITAQRRLSFTCVTTSLQLLNGNFITSRPLCCFRSGWPRYSPFSPTRTLWSYRQTAL